MNIKLSLSVVPGGIYSQLMSMITYTARLDVDKIYFNSVNATHPVNPFDWVFEQSCDDTFTEIQCVNNGGFTKDGADAYGCLEKYEFYPQMKKALGKVVIKRNIIEKVDMFCAANIFSNTIGVHVRTGDMNVIHPDYGVFVTEDYIKLLDRVFIESNRPNIFVASDNTDSIRHIKHRFKPYVVSYGCKLLEDSDWFDSTSLQAENLNNPLFWEEAFIDMLILSRCNQLICRVSNFANIAILFSNKITKIHRL